MMPTSDIGKLGLSNLYWNILVVCSPPSPAHTLILICPEYGGWGETRTLLSRFCRETALNHYALQYSLTQKKKIFDFKLNQDVNIDLIVNTLMKIVY